MRRAGPPSGVRQPGRRPVPVQMLRRTQRSDHELDGAINVLVSRKYLLLSGTRLGRTAAPPRRRHWPGREFRGVPGSSGQPAPRAAVPGWRPDYPAMSRDQSSGRHPRTGQTARGAWLRWSGSGEAARRIREAVKQTARDSGRSTVVSWDVTRCLDADGEESPDLDPAPCSMEASSRLISNECRMVTAERERARMPHSARVIWIWTSRPSMGPGEQRGQRDRQRCGRPVS